MKINISLSKSSPDLSTLNVTKKVLSVSLKAYIKYLKKLEWRRGLNQTLDVLSDIFKRVAKKEGMRGVTLKVVQDYIEDTLISMAEKSKIAKHYGAAVLFNKRRQKKRV